MRVRTLLLILLLAAALPLAVERAHAQPRWSFWAEVSGALYPGEAQNVIVILRNTMCVERRPEIRFSYEDRTYGFLLADLDEVQMRRLEERAQEGVRRGIFASYEIAVNRTNWVWRGEKQVLVSSVTVVLRDYCVYEPIRVERVRVWFPWRGYGRSLSSEVLVGIVLRGANVEEFPLSLLTLITPKPTHEFFYDPYLNLTIPFHVPADVPSELLGRQGMVVEVDARTEGGLWTFGGPFGQPQVVVTGQVDVRPFRTFTLRVTDEEGVIPLAGAEVLLRAHVYPFELRLTTNSSGVVEVRRLPDDYHYRATIRYRPPMLNQSVTVLVADVDARGLVVGGLRADLHALRVHPRDLRGRPLEGAVVALRATELQLAPGVEGVPMYNETRGGLASFHLLPTGNYSWRVYWRNVEVCSGTIYLGYHPTYGRRPGVLQPVCGVGDLVVRVVDGSGSPVGAELSVSGVAPVSPDVMVILLQERVYARNGTVVIPQLPAGTFEASATNRSSAFGTEASGSASLRVERWEAPEVVLEIRLPIHGVRVRLLSADGDPLEGFEFQLGPVRVRAEGEAVFAGVPAGTYGVRAWFRGVEVLSVEVRVEGSLELELRARVYRASFSLKDLDGQPVIGRWTVSGPGGTYSDLGSSGSTGPLPEAPHRLEVRARVLGGEEIQLNTTFLPSQLRNATLTLPLLRPVLQVLWSDGAPFDGRVELPDLGIGAAVTQGRAELSERVRAGAHRVRVLTGQGLLAHDGNVELQPGGARVAVQATPITVRVLDLLGQPVTGATVQVMGSQGMLLGEGSTDASGRLLLPRLPALQQPYLVRVSWGGRVVEGVSRGGELELRLDAISIGGTALDPALVGVAAAAGAGLGALLVARRIKKR
ncbi:MAG: hypothetical protein QXW56_02515 [Nitrososphaerota archaeon]